MVTRSEFIDIPDRRGSRARVCQDERSALERLAEVERLNLSAALRLAIREACRARGLWPPPLEGEVK